MVLARVGTKLIIGIRALRQDLGWGITAQCAVTAKGTYMLAPLPRKYVYTWERYNKYPYPVKAPNLDNRKDGLDWVWVLGFHPPLWFPLQWGAAEAASIMGDGKLIPIPNQYHFSYYPNQRIRLGMGNISYNVTHYKLQFGQKMCSDNKSDQYAVTPKVTYMRVPLPL